jgi:hypothetical protein
VITWNDTGTIAGLRLFLILSSFILGGLAAIATVLAFFGATWWPFDWLANLRWYLAWILFLAAVVYSLTSKGWFLGVVSVALLTNLLLVIPLWIGSQPDSTGEDSISVVHIDAQSGFDDLRTAVDWMLALDADVLLVARGTSELVDELVGPESDWMVLLEPELDNTAGELVFAKQAWDVAVTPTGVGSDTVIRVTVGSGAVSYDVITAWGPTATGKNHADRLAARLDTIEALTTAASGPVVVIGDIGATRWTHGVRTLFSTTDLRDATKGKGYLSTSRASDFPVLGGWLGLPLDIVFMTSDATPIDLETGPNMTTDHLPVRVVVGPTR